MNTESVLIVGVGNILREDDGIGIRIVNYLSNEIKTNNKNICFLDCGIKTFYLLDIVREYDKIVIIDAINFQSPPGTVKLFNQNEIQTIINQRQLFNFHSFNLNEVFLFAEYEKIIDKFLLIGIQPYSIAYKNELSNELKKKEEEIKNEVKKIINKILDF